MPVAYKKIASVTVTGATAANIEFTNIPGTFTDLCILTSIRTSRTASKYGNMKITFNTSTSNITGRFLRQFDTSTESFSTTAVEWGAPTAATTASTFGNAIIYIPNYAGSTNKSVLVDSVIEDNSTTAFNYLSVGLWSQTTAITGLSLYTSDASSDIAQHSTAVLYGISKS